MISYGLIKAAADAVAGERPRGWSDKRYQAHIRKRWDGLAKSVHTHGVQVGQNKRIMIPKRVLSEQDLKKHLGFKGVNIAVPEAGQTKLRSFRHPDHNYHIHEHGDSWSVHHDEHPSTTMLWERLKKQKQEAAHAAAAKTKGSVSAAMNRARAQSAGHGNSQKQVTMGQVASATIKGMPHLIGEGVPGMAYYIGGRIKRAPGMRAKVEPHLPKEYLNRVKRLRASRTADATQ